MRLHCKAVATKADKTISNSKFLAWREETGCQQTDLHFCCWPKGCPGSFGLLGRPGPETSLDRSFQQKELPTAGHSQCKAKNQIVRLLIESQISQRLLQPCSFQGAWRVCSSARPPV